MKQRLVIRENPDEGQIDAERRAAFLQLTGEERVKTMLAWVELMIMLNPNGVLKKPDGVHVFGRQTLTTHV